MTRKNPHDRTAPPRRTRNDLLTGLRVACVALRYVQHGTARCVGFAATCRTYTVTFRIYVNVLLKDDRKPQRGATQCRTAPQRNATQRYAFDFERTVTLDYIV